MPQFFFIVVDGKKSQIKDEGLDLPDGHAAWAEATMAC
jgi:hypothetical protein